MLESDVKIFEGYFYECVFIVLFKVIIKCCLVEIWVKKEVVKNKENIMSFM